MKNKYLISLVGATGIGKTALSIELAKYYHTEILSSDSRQFYKEMSIGTAVPSEKELNEIQHHFIQNRSIFDDYNVGSFEHDALELLSHLFKHQDVVLMVGGSGLYVDAVLRGLDHFPEVDPKIRASLLQEISKKGIGKLQKRLKLLDPISFDKIDIDNHQRLARALEICLGTGHPYSSFLNRPKKKRSFKIIEIGIQADRAVVYARINQRVDQMIEQGLVDEVKSLLPFRQLNALQTVGYKELFSYFDGEMGLEDAIAEIKKNTRRFAKRQGTWFKRYPQIKWFDYQENLTRVVDYLDHKILHLELTEHD